MVELCEGRRDHLLMALRTDDPEKKNYHIRHVLQATGVDTPEELDVELKPLATD